MHTLFHIANEKFKSGQLSEAIDLYLKAISDNPNFFAYHQNLSLALIKAGRYTEARRHIEKAKTLAPQVNFTSLQRKATDTTTPRLSIITPAHNTGKYLHQCIQSILNQTFHDFELIIVDDGSTDETYEIANSFKSKDHRIKVIQNKSASGNPGTPRNQALRVARGEYIGFVDSDDWIEENFYFELIQEADQGKCDIVFSSGFRNHTQTEISTRKYNHLNFDNPNSDFFRYHESFMIWDKIFRRSLLEDNQIWLGETKAAVDVPFISRHITTPKKSAFAAT